MPVVICAPPAITVEPWYPSRTEIVSTKMSWVLLELGFVKRRYVGAEYDITGVITGAVRIVCPPPGDAVMVGGDVWPAPPFVTLTPAIRQCPVLTKVMPVTTIVAPEPP